MSMERNNGPEQEQEQYSFLQEKIKDDTFDKKKLMHKVAKTVGAGLAFGTAASISFFMFKPWLETTFQKNPNEVTIPKDEERGEALDEEQVTKPIQQTLTMEQYKELSYALRQVSAEAEKSMVQVIRIHDMNNWAEENPDEDSAAGVIVADNGSELLILVNTSVLQDAKAMKVRFADGMQYDAVVKKKDGNINMAILSVSKRSIRDATWSKIKVAQLGNSNVLTKGETLIALGEPFSYADGLGIGVASSVDHNVILADGSYNVIVTDMAGTLRSSGALFDVDGNVVGIISPDFFKGEDNGVMTAFGISSVKTEIELLSNAKAVPYLGIKGVMVTDELSKANHIPKGLYVIEVEADSPALNAGIQSGDIITHVGQMKIESDAAYHNNLLKQVSGSGLTLKGERHGAEDYVEISFDAIVGIKE